MECDRCKKEVSDLTSHASIQGENTNLCDSCVFAYVRELTVIARAFHLTDLQNTALRTEIDSLKTLNEALIQEFESSQQQQIEQETTQLATAN